MRSDGLYRHNEAEEKKDVANTSFWDTPIKPKLLNFSET